MSRTNRKSRKESRRRSAGKAKSVRAMTLEGEVTMNRDGMGFVTTKELPESVVVRVSRMRGALNGDRVKVGVYARKTASGRFEGEIVSVTERSPRPHIGTLAVRGNKMWCIMESRTMPYDIRLQLASPDELPTIGGIRAEDGVKIAVLVTEWPKGVPEPLGRIVDVLGRPGDNETEMHSILAEYNLPYRFESEVEKAAQSISGKISKKEIGLRRDFRKVTTFTIDPADAKDFDDAISLRRMEGGRFEVGVHIADVTHYVKPGDIVDKEAEVRGTSVYLVDRTVPMLPEKLCNDLCSLRPGEDKLSFSAVFEMDEKGKVHSRWMGRAIINSDRRFNYDEVQEIITTGKGDYCEEISILYKLSSQLRAGRFKKGSINFERPEMKVIVDEEGKPLDVVQKVEMESNALVEEFMLLANREVASCVAKKCKAKDPAFVYRVHDKPNGEKLEELRKFALNFKYDMGNLSNPKKAAAGLNDLMEKSKGTPEENPLKIMALRSMARACYSTDNIGHYGLAFNHYCHFTSPIRRYPDMMVHRLLTHYMEGGASQDREYFEERCRYASQREQLATEAERASIKYKMIEFMQDKIGREFDGTISGLTEWGIYVEIEPTRIEGMVPLREVEGDCLVFDQDNYRIVSKATGRIYNLGDRVRIKVTRASLEQKILDFQLIQKTSL